MLYDVWFHRQMLKETFLNQFKVIATARKKNHIKGMNNIHSATAGVASGTCIKDQLRLRSNAGSEYIAFSIHTI